MPKHIREEALGTGDFHMKTRLSSQRLRMTEDPQLVDYLLLLRFGTSDPGQAARPVLNFASISKVVRKPVSTIRPHQAWHRSEDEVPSHPDAQAIKTRSTSC